MLQWLVDSWARGEGAHMHMHLCVQVWMILELCGYDSGAQYNPHLQYTFTAQSFLQRCDGEPECDDILVGIWETFI